MYRFSYRIEMNRGVAIRLSVYGIASLFVGSTAFQYALGRVNYGAAQPALVGVGVVLTYVLTLAVHELVHGVFFRVFGGEPSYGLSLARFLPVAWATCPGKEFTLPQMFVVGLAPFVLVSLAAVSGAFVLPSLALYLLIAFLGNVSGAVGDLWLMSKLFKFRHLPGVRVVDAKDALIVLSSASDIAAIGEGLFGGSSLTREKFLTRFLGGSFGFFVVSFVVSLLGPLFQRSMTLGPEWLPLLQYSTTSEAQGFSIGLVPALVAGALFAALAALIDVLVRSHRAAGV